MHAADTNILIRIVVRDEGNQAEAADHFIRRGAWVSLVGLAELAWVLKRTYGFHPARLAAAMEMLLTHQDLSFQDADAATAALESSSGNTPAWVSRIASC